MIATLLVVYVVTVLYKAQFSGTVSAAVVLNKGSNTARLAASYASYAVILLPSMLLIVGLAAGLGSKSYWVPTRVVSGLALFVAIIDLLVAPFFALFGTEATMLVQFTTAVSLLCWQALVFSWAGSARSEIAPSMSTPGRLLLGLPVAAVAAWSLVTGIAAASQTIRLSGGRPYCIATPRVGTLRDLAGGIWKYTAITSLEELRGVRLYTDATGYKESSRWYFHALLVIREEKLDGYWQWSIRRMKFEKFTERGYGTSEACEPVPDFLSRLHWF